MSHFLYWWAKQFFQFSEKEVSDEVKALDDSDDDLGFDPDNFDDEDYDEDYDKEFYDEEYEDDDYHEDFVTGLII